MSTDKIAAGVFGTVYKGIIVSLQQPIANKKLHSAKEIILAEVKLASEMNGNINFPFIFGLAKNNLILIELIKNMDGLTSPTLFDLFPENLNREEFVNIAVQLVKGVHSLHCKGITHNDLHTRNLIIRDRRYLKIIDMGKASFIDDPVEYNIQQGSKRQNVYNTRHRHLAFELSYVCGSKTSIYSDIYSVGYVIDRVATSLKYEKMVLLASSMLNKEPERRPHFDIVLSNIQKL